MADDAFSARLAPFLGPREEVRVVAWCERSNIGEAFTAVPPAQRHASHPVLRKLESIVDPEVLFQAPAHYLAVTDRRLMLLSAASADFRAYALADVAAT